MFVTTALDGFGAQPCVGTTDKTISPGTTRPSSGPFIRKKMG